MSKSKFELRGSTRSIAEHPSEWPTQSTTTEQAVQGIMAVIGEHQSPPHSADIKRAIALRVHHGKAPGRTPLGYSNVVDRVNGHRRNSVVLDRSTAPDVAWAFRTFASDQCNLTFVREQLTWRGLRTVPTRTAAAHPIRTADLRRLFTNPFYKGSIRYGGEIYPGTHPKLIGTADLERIQLLLGATSQVNRS